MRATVSRVGNAVTLIGLGLVLLSFYFTGRLDHYLHPQFRPYTLIAGFAFCFIGLVYGFVRSNVNCCVDGECLHSQAANPTRSLIACTVVLLPLVAGATFSRDGYDQQVVLNRGFVQDVKTLPSRSDASKTNRSIPGEALGADIDETASANPADTSNSIPNATPATAAANAGPGSDEGSAQYLPIAPDGNVALEVTDLLYGESEQSLRELFTGKTVEVLGQYLPGSGAGQFKLVRMFIVCCAADARPVAVTVQAPAAMTASADMAWVKVTGKAEYTKNGEKAHVLLKASKVEATEPPAEAMLY